MKKFLLILFISCFAFIGVKAQETSKKVALYWDTSYGMIDKDLEKEFSFLDSYFNQNPDVSLELTMFSNTVILKERFRITNGSWKILKSELKNAVYDGAAAFKNIFLDSVVDEILFVSDGRETIDELPSTFSKPVYVICSVSNANISKLNDLALSSGGVFFQLNKTKNETTNSENELIIVEGIVTDSFGSISGVSVYSRGTTKSTITNEEGRYSIEARANGILEFSHLGKNTVISKVPVSGIKNIMLSTDNEVLDEVVITAASEKDNTEVVNTGNTTVDKKRLGYAVETITDEDIAYTDTNIREAIAGQFSNIEVGSDQDLSQFLSRGKNMTILGNQYGLIVLDGVPLNTSDSSFGLGSVTPTEYINPDNVASITVLKGLAATNKWGTLGRNGVILITSKTMMPGVDLRKKEVVLGTTATYTGGSLVSKNLPNTPYINALKKSKDIDEAYAIYLKQRETYGNEASFFIDVASYFKDWNNPYLLERILSNVSELEGANTNTLLAQAYKYQEFDMFGSAVSVYKKILKMKPDHIQAYRNLALVYNEATMYKEALKVYDNFDKQQYVEVIGSKGLNKTINNEFKNLVALHKGEIDISKINTFYTNNIIYNTRVVFEWNEYDAEFDLQIVNPQNRFFTWSHTLKEESARLLKEQTEGYGLEEFFMTLNDSGKWLFNVTYLGKRTGDNATPTYLKITTYKNFGKYNQTQKVKVISLNDLNKQVTVLEVNI